MEAWFEKNLLEPEFPFEMFINEGSCSVPHHWHDEIEIIYMISCGVRVGINNKMYNLQEKDILIISSGDIHCFLPEPNESKRLVIRFNLSIFDNVISGINERKEIRSLFESCKRFSREWDCDVKSEMEQHINKIYSEYNEKKKGYKLALKALLYEFVVMLLRRVPEESINDGEASKQRESFNRLENVFQYVESNYSSDISLRECADKAGFSIYHFSRFFKQNMGMTFNQYLSNFRITKAEWLLMSEEHNITEIAMQCGFNNVKTFDRVFKELKGQSPSQFRKKQNLRTT